MKSPINDQVHTPYESQLKLFSESAEEDFKIWLKVNFFYVLTALFYILFVFGLLIVTPFLMRIGLFPDNVETINWLIGLFIPIIRKMSLDDSQDQIMVYLYAMTWLYVFVVNFIFLRKIKRLPTTIKEVELIQSKPKRYYFFQTCLFLTVVAFSIFPVYLINYQRESPPLGYFDLLCSFVFICASMLRFTKLLLAKSRLLKSSKE